MSIKITVFTLSLATALAITGCGPNPSILESGNRNTTPAENVSIEKSSMEQDLEAMRTADFSVIFVMRRRDGGAFDAEDRALVRKNTSQANRRVAADEGRVVIVGSNFPIAPENMKALEGRFLIEDHSPPPANTNANANANSNSTN